MTSSDDQKLCVAVRLDGTGCHFFAVPPTPYCRVHGGHFAAEIDDMLAIDTGLTPAAAIQLVLLRGARNLLALRALCIEAQAPTREADAVLLVGILDGPENARDVLKALLEANRRFDEWVDNVRLSVDERDHYRPPSTTDTETSDEQR